MSGKKITLKGEEFYTARLKIKYSGKEEPARRW